MADYRLAEAEAKFADIIWQNEPINSTALVKLCETAMNWQKSTTYTILRRLCARGLFRCEGATVTALITREEYFAHQSRRYVEDTFGGSLPKFITSFMGGQRLSDIQAMELIDLIRAHAPGEGSEHSNG